ncbi:MAG TPA: DUF4157 domain-containing protein, partial [Chitinophagaceae bacterium]|nr:DUF4157 domain-containing protein [Chitinophagaceae bacterium]
MGETADKTLKPSTRVQHVARKSSFFGKDGGEPSFFSAASQSKGFFGAHGTSIQAKLNVSKPEDPQEKEADQVAEKVMTMPQPAAATTGKQDEEKVQTKPAQVMLMGAPEHKEEDPPVQKKEEEEKEQEVQRMEQEKDEKLQRKEEEETEEVVQTKCAACDAEDKQEEHIHPKRIPGYIIQRSGRGPPRTSRQFEHSLSDSKGGGSPLPADTRQFMESRFGADFSGVRIHTGTRAERMNSQVHAQAFTHGNDIYFNSGKYSPGTTSGSLLLAHELTHTIQQGASRHVSSPSSSPGTTVSTKANVARKTLIQRVGEGAAVPQLGAAVEKAKAKEGKINANTEGPDGYRTGWQDLLEIFKSTFGEEQIVTGSGQQGSVAEADIKKKRTVDNMLIVDPVNTSNTKYGSRDAMPSWCGIFVIWALNKSGVPMPKWKLGENIFKPEAAYPGGYVPKPGDIAYRSAFSHYAMVEKVNGSTVTTVNGNTAGEDNLGGQVQSRDHPISDWTGFFNPLVLKTGDLGTGERGEEKTRSLAELRKKLFGVSRKAEHETAPQELKEDEKKENEQVDKKDIQTKPELSNWGVNRKGELQPATVESTAEEKELQKKEEQDKEEELPSRTVQKHIQRSDAGTAGARGPPLQTINCKLQTMIQRSWLGDAWNAVAGLAGEAAAFIERGLDAAKEWLLGKVRDFVSGIPGYRLASVILGSDPITGQQVERNGTNLLNAGLDILPFGHMFR